MIKAITEIKPHELNSAIYGDSADQDLIDSIQKVGVLNPLLITETGIIISGHRRYAACLQLHIDYIPVIISGLTNENDIIEALIISNKQREKTTEQKAREYRKLKEIEEMRARERMSEGGGDKKSEDYKESGRENFPYPKNNGKSSDIAASKIGMSGKTAEKAAKVVETIDALEEIGEDEEAENLRNTLNKSVSGAVKNVHVANNSGENEWYTPEKFIISAREAMGSIDTDPASSELANKTVQAKQYFTKDNDGLTQTWQGNVWMNPPYAQPLMTHFANAVSEKFESGEIDQAIILVNNATETGWFKTMSKVCSVICFTSGRIKFIDKNGEATGAPLQGQAIIYMGFNEQFFIDAFTEHGMCFRRIQND